jgi:hypothetical protein
MIPWLMAACDGDGGRDVEAVDDLCEVDEHYVRTTC